MTNTMEFLKLYTVGQTADLHRSNKLMTLIKVMEKTNDMYITHAHTQRRGATISQIEKVS